MQLLEEKQDLPAAKVLITGGPKLNAYQHDN